MIFEAQVKFAGDEYPGGYANGLTMLDSGTMGRFKAVSEDEKQSVKATDDGIVLTCVHERVDRLERYVTGSDDACVWKHETVISNNSDKPVTMEMLTSVCVRGIRADKVYRMTSFWSAEGRLKVDRITDLNLEVSWAHHGTRVEKFGAIGSMPVKGWFPFVALEDSETGRFVAVTLYTPSSWQLELVVRRTEELTIAGGIADADYGHWMKTLEPGESFAAPRALVAEGSSLLEVCDLILKAQQPDISPVDDCMGVSFNEYCTTWGDPTIENMKRICDKLEGKGIQYLVMDSGWYLEKGQNWWDYVGKWEVNSNRFPNGLSELAEYVRSKGMIPGMWFEPESVAWGCELYERPEYLLCRNGVPITVGGKRFLDMENDFVRGYLRDKVIRLLKENNFGYVKIDYNDSIGSGCENCAPGKAAEGQGENLRRKLLASQDFFRELRREIPDLVIENCSSGGHRLEPSMMELSSMASFSDAHETLSIPLIAANLQRLVRAEQNQIWAVLRKEDSDARIFYSLCATFMGRIGMSGDIYDLSEHQWRLVDEGLEFYRQYSDVIKNGSVIAIETDVESYNNPVGSQWTARKHGDLTLVIAHRFKGEEFSLANGELGKLFEGKEVIAQYGDISCEFSAESWVLRG